MAPSSLRIGRVLLSIVVLCALVFFRADRNVAAPQLPTDKLLAKQKRFIEYSRNFTNYRKSAGSECLEHDTATALLAAAWQTHDLLIATETMLMVYGDVSSSKDRNKNPAST
jgi:hypothetical protein